VSLPVILRPEAEADIECIHDELEALRAGLGGQFVAEVRRAIQHIEAMPEMYGVVWNDLRAARLRRFRHIVYYVLFTDRVELIAVMHGSRDSSDWQSRV